MRYRKIDFKLGCIHGKLQPQELKSEAKMRNDIFLIGHVGLVLSKNETIKIKLIANEMPLEDGKSRGRCIDLFGIDKDWNAYIIELKLAKTKERLEKVVDQVSDYARIFEIIKSDIENEMRSELYYKNFSFSGQTRKIIITHKDYYSASQNDPMKYKDHESLYICSFSRISSIEDQNEINLLKRNKSSIQLLAIKNRKLMKST